MPVTFRTLFGAALAAGLAMHASAGEFQYSIPQGWWDIAPNGADRARDMTGVPPAVVNEAASGRFKVYAIDPTNTTGKVPGASFNAVEQPGKVVVTLDEVNKAAAELVEGLAAAGIKASVDEYRVFKVNGVAMGMMTVDLPLGANPRMLRQYLIPGKKTATVLTYAAPRYEFHSYLPVFEASASATMGGSPPALDASARATKGASDHGGYTWKRGFTAAGTGGLVGAIVYIVFVLERRRRAVAAQRAATESGEGAAPAPPRAVAPAAQKASKYVWNCPGCGNPVPMRLEQCRCGTAKPA